MGRRWSSARASFNEGANEASANYYDWYNRRRYVGKLPQVVFYVVCLGIAWWIAGPRFAVILVLISLAVGVATVVVGLLVVMVVVWRRRRGP
jgi:hypothetical protein